MKVLCVIPVRGGSKGVPRKNIRPLAGRPLVAWTVQQARAAAAELAPEHELHVLVSTDDAEIAEIAREAGADVPFLRPAELAEDTTATEPVVVHALDYRAGTGEEPDAVMLLQATSPLRLPGTLARAVREFAASGVDSLVGVVPMGPFVWTLGDPPTAAYPVESRQRRQDMRPEDLRYRENGSLYVTRPRLYREDNNRLGGRIGLFMLDELEGVDIDTELDFHVAEQQVARHRAQLGLEEPRFQEKHGQETQQ